jgi:hypothetical protein
MEEQNSVFELFTKEEQSSISAFQSRLRAIEHYEKEEQAGFWSGVREFWPTFRLVFIIEIALLGLGFFLFEPLYVGLTASGLLLGTCFFLAIKAQDWLVFKEMNSSFFGGQAQQALNIYKQKMEAIIARLEKENTLDAASKITFLEELLKQAATH